MARALYYLGAAFRETGQALDRVGMTLGLNFAFQEEFYRHRPVMNIVDKKPALATGAWVAPSAAVIGSVNLGPSASVWYNSVVKGDSDTVSIGEKSNVQDSAVIVGPTTIGKAVTIGHGASLYGCTIGDASLVGINATVQAGAKVETGAVVAAGAVVGPGITIPAGQVWGGNPARFLRAVKPEEANFFQAGADEYAKLATEHASA
uniref:Gamma carbonic anhydrase n=1 Tax=Tetraselmis chuii TaxID=63592 RepID=A0A7S1X1M9_9CHLO|mmetsp:Transcript_19708/g.35183  ORF Transcript_19708/g.35183 Transcript_19708/m.35183 type:complete len:205 (+) Transcript_19708:83-697(+)|eukprot:CAMPEP_0177762574 /NCGR_PEP_ID=MMETSP0491_2-20121128/6417_1 /TAXON_ID=63592 /ORGANISM="Tetraselmis chuii, Strain PLY429" /LENGTH=204 /DNA_ID=CAMNT_0019278637 /DNA_START=70 /DNA_END=684 /DNA_ORIENTATION=-